MAETYSDFYNSVQTVEDGVGTSTIVLASTAAAQAVDKTWTARAGTSGARSKIIVARSVVATIGGTDDDIVRMFTLPSSARIIKLGYASEGTSTAYLCNVGVYLAGANHDGAVVDEDLFASALDVSTAVVDLTDCFREATTLTPCDRGRPLWHLCNLGAATTYTSDPQVEFDICLTSTVTLTTVIETMMLVCEYTSG